MILSSRPDHVSGRLGEARPHGRGEVGRLGKGLDDHSGEAMSEEMTVPNPDSFQPRGSQALDPGRCPWGSLSRSLVVE